jgi:hypothetical protein
MDFRNICKAILTFAVVVAAAVGCKKEEHFEGPLGLHSRRIVIPAETGSTPIMVFSNTSWKVKFTSEVTWAGIDKLSGEGSSCIYFSYAANYGEEREVALAFDASGVRDTVVVVQSGK